tara:strand:- start:1741 stop:2112 length:372 start_codon:yes stop_codon:yes gene_type:complete
MMIRALALSGLLALGACSTVQRIPGVPGGDRNDTNRLETLLETRVVSGNILVIRVESNGCTQKADFELDVNRRSGGYAITVERTREDYCRAIVHGGVEIPYGFEELGIRSGSTVTVVNPIAGN